ncbi:hypothetical protein F5141DRAFT_1066228 [Pisolithus sp. B1]|nr:hypothetical protein F5141DRAFT_1066228 [Pisolithus sp. B1]
MARYVAMLPTKQWPTRADDYAGGYWGYFRALEGLWEVDAQFLASILQFLYVVWQQGQERKARIDVTHQAEDFWSRIAAIAWEELGPYPDYVTNSFTVLDDERRSALHEAVSVQACRGVAKTYAVRIVWT